MVNLARGIPGIPLDHELLDVNPYLLGVLNGVVDLHTGILRPADPADLMTMQAPIQWDAKARAPRWERAMQEWFPNPELRAYTQRVAGSVLMGAQRDHTIVIHYGSGGNGKGTFIRAVEYALGPYAVVLHLSLIEQRRFPEHDTIKADLFRARLAIASETERRIKLAEASVKNLTGGDRIRARRMREDPWSFDPSHSLWLQTNYLPEIAGRDTGIWRRIRVIKWVATFAPAEEDLDATFRAEAPGILRWLVEGYLDWQRDGLMEPEAVIRETLAYRKSEDTFSRFAAECGLVFRLGLEMQASELQDHLTTWAEEEGIDPPRREIGNWLRENGARKRQRRVVGPDGKETRPKFWAGVGIDANDDETGQDDDENRGAN
jgi:putative DNA primase/helicase